MENTAQNTAETMLRELLNEATIALIATEELGCARCGGEVDEDFFCFACGHVTPHRVIPIAEIR